MRTRIESLFNHRARSFTLAAVLTAVFAGAAPVTAQADCPSYCFWGCPSLSDAPFVFVHGGVGYASSWTEIISDLKDHYEGQCRTLDTHTVDLSFFGPQAALAEELRDEVAIALAMYDADKVHLVGHSYASRSIREFTSAMQSKLYEGDAGGHVASVTLLAGDNAPSTLADTALGIYDVAPGLWDEADDAVWGLFEWITDSGKSANADIPTALQQLSTPGSADFEARNPNVPGVGYLYHGGRTRNMNTLQPAHLAFGPTWAFLRLLGEQNDGLVSIEMARGVENPPHDWTLHEGSMFSIGVSHNALIGQADAWGYDVGELYIDIVERALDWD